MQKLCHLHSHSHSRPHSNSHLPLVALAIHALAIVMLGSLYSRFAFFLAFSIGSFTGQAISSEDRQPFLDKRDVRFEFGGSGCSPLNKILIKKEMATAAKMATNAAAKVGSEESKIKKLQTYLFGDTADAVLKGENLTDFAETCIETLQKLDTKR